MNKKNGFTIIEVVLVLGIAALIFMMAFIALPSLWASQRDADRKASVMELISNIKTYQTNNSRGAFPVLIGNGPEKFVVNREQLKLESLDPNSWKAFVRDYVSVDFVDASGNDYELYVVNCLSSSGSSLSVGETCAYQSDFGDANSIENINGGTVDHVIYVAIGATCDGDHAVKANSNRNVAAVQVLERGGRYCHNT